MTWRLISLVLTSFMAWYWMPRLPALGVIWALSAACWALSLWADNGRRSRR